MKPVRLYHFTKPKFLPSVLRHGIKCGSVPTDDDSDVPGICLTKEKRPERQIWTGANIEKRYIRLTVSLEPDDKRLRSWKRFSRDVGMPAYVYKTLNITGAGNGRIWWVYLGNIEPASIKEVWDYRLKRCLTVDERIQKFCAKPEVSSNEIASYRLHHGPTLTELLEGAA